MTEREKFVDWFRRRKKGGLVDVKFFVNPDAELSIDGFFAAANRIAARVEEGKCEKHSTWPKLAQKDITSLLK